MELFKFWNRKPSKREVLAIWRAAKRDGDIPARKSFARYGELRQVWGGYVVVAN